MDRISFAPLIDLPLVAFTVILFIWHFNRWAISDDLDTNVDLSARLPAARMRVIVLFATILIVFWLANYAVWILFVFLIGSGLVIGGGAGGGELGLWAAAYVIREWAFGFPEIILHPAPASTNTFLLQTKDGELMGKTGITTSHIRPMGNAEFDGVSVSVSSEDGRWIDVGTDVTVTAYRNGRPCVSPRS